jgi:hypothetical protein
MRRSQTGAVVLSVLVLAAGAIIFAILLPPTVTTTAAKPHHSRPAAASCVTGKIQMFFANIFPKEGPLAFGPNPDPRNKHDGRALGRTVEQSICVDPALAHTLYWDWVSKAIPLDAHIGLAEWRREVAALNAIVEWPSATAVHETLPADTMTYEMVPTASHRGWPTVRRLVISAAHRSSEFLELVVREGTAKIMKLVRIACRFQPEDLDEPSVQSSAPALRPSAGVLPVRGEGSGPMNYLDRYQKPRNAYAAGVFVCKL